MVVVSCENSFHLASEIANLLAVGCCRSEIFNYSCGEEAVRVNTYDPEVLVVASTADQRSWMELYLLLNALRDAKTIVLCVSYLGYARQDEDKFRKSKGGEVFVKFLENFSNILSCIFIDCHSMPQIKIPFQHLSAEEVFVNHIQSKHNVSDVVLVSPDEGRREQVIRMSKMLGCAALIGKKTRDCRGRVEKVIFDGDVQGKGCILIDDIVDTGTSLCHASRALAVAGSQEIIAYVTHGVLSGSAVDDLSNSVIKKIFLTNSIQQEVKLPVKFGNLSLASLIVGALRCIL
ncbi:MAG: ribose-phosphate pyrophosphokinase [Alphaproteobacteria bacterium]|nr:ribose-phosphate pyrophosphokinase [Alphaproteobacteria bacterium]